MKIESYMPITLSETDWIRTLAAIDAFISISSQKNQDFPNNADLEMIRLRSFMVSELVMAGIMTKEAETGAGITWLVNYLKRL